GRLAGASIAVADLPRARQWFLQKFAIEAAAAKAAPAQPLTIPLTAAQLQALSGRPATTEE
ncbi:MAG: hypothetical protein NTV86_20745, partial [Planctomycetota bacterium]|nr:hypothetical protein [Planctomycetota bacterium]